MGGNLALNINDHGSPSRSGTSRAMTDKFVADNQRRTLTGTKSLAELVGALERPRRILMMIKAGKPVDSMLEQLKPLLEKGDIVIDGGNTHFQETRAARPTWRQARHQLRRHGRLGRRGGRAARPVAHAGRHDRGVGAPQAPVLESIAAKTEQRRRASRTSAPTAPATS